MELEDQVVSLDLAKRLKELGVKQESLYSWSVPDVSKAQSGINADNLKKCEPGLFPSDVPWGEFFEPIAAFTVAELGEMLPVEVTVPEGDSYLLKLHMGTRLASRAHVARVLYEDVDEDNWLHSVEADTEADARAKMLIYLIENKLITV
jgi:hypothetical protein